MSNSIRLCFRVKEPCRFVSHLDKIRSMERAIRRAKIPMAYSQGFNQRPRFAFGSALPVGVTSDAEYVDLHLAEYHDAMVVKKNLNQVLPTGFEVVEAINLPVNSDALMSIIKAARYRFSFWQKPTKFSSEKVDLLLNKENIFITKHTKKGFRKTDIRSLIYKLRLENDGTHLLLECACGSNGNLRPMDVLAPLDLNLEDVLIHREALWINYQQGKVSSPLDIVEG